MDLIPGVDSAGDPDVAWTALSAQYHIIYTYEFLSIEVIPTSDPFEWIHYTGMHMRNGYINYIQPRSYFQGI